MKKMISLYDLNYSDIQLQLQEWKQPKFRVQQIWEWLYQKHVVSFEEMTNLPATLRQQLEDAYILGRLDTVIDLTSKDGLTRKILFELPGNVRIEAVKMTYKETEKSRRRNTLCISSQAGCALGCTFCATGQGGFQRNLTSGEIVEQVLFYIRELAKKDDRVTNIVFMGMGEPFANYDNVMSAVRKLTDPNGIGLGARRLTISTVGLAPQIERFAQENIQVNLAISLHAATDELRGKSMPVNDRYPIAELMKACRKYVLATNRRISFEWAMINRVNDTVQQATFLAEQIQDLLCHVNLIPLNPTKGFQHKASDPLRIKAFQAILNDYGVPNSVRARKGLDINAACGQLSQQYDVELKSAE